ncbi:MAG: protein-L-isoaspartate(D-aspartate) O-methyltransferase [Nanoarchaeota archaeon]
MSNQDLFLELRKDMVEYQLRRRDITEKNILKVFAEIPRHEFVPQEYLDQAYDDHPVQIGEGQTISQPYMVALMTQCLEPKPTDIVLELGTGSGYQAAILGRLVKKVYTLERHAQLAENAKKVLDKLHIDNIEVVRADATKGYPKSAPFDKIIVTAYAKAVPRALFSQLKEGGIMVIPLGSALGQLLFKITKKGNEMRKKPICECVFVPVIEGD